MVQRETTRGKKRIEWGGGETWLSKKRPGEKEQGSGVHRAKVEENRKDRPRILGTLTLKKSSEKKREVIENGLGKNRHASKNAQTPLTTWDVGEKQ